MSDSLPILSAFDDHYAPHFAVMCRSLTLAHAPQNENKSPRPAFILVANFLSPVMRARIEQLVAACNASLRWLTLDLAPIANAPLTMHFTRATYARLIAFNALPDLDRVLYLDPDMIILADLAPLSEIDLQNNPLAAVLDPANTFDCADHKAALGIPLDALCFNCGLLLVDLHQWRTQNSTLAALKFLDGHRPAIRWVDQDVLNGLFHHRWTRLASTWNAQTHFWKPQFRAALRHSLPAELATIDSPRIVHFNDGAKPWHFAYPHPFRKHYFDLLAQTPWPHTVYEFKQNGIFDKMVIFK